MCPKQGRDHVRYDGLGKTVSSIVLAPLTLFLPSDVSRANLTKLVILGALFATFFLFAGRVWLPGGATQFLDYADAIVHHTILPPSVAQRDAGYPLLIILSGYPFLKSLLPILLIQAAFAVALPMLIYASLQRLSIPLAFVTALVCLLTLAPYYFIKMVHHDQTYIFFSILLMFALLLLVQTKEIRFLYLFTVVAIFASIVRPAGNILFPIFLVVAYVAIRGNVRHYLICSIIFGLALAAYTWHRQMIFDVKDVGSNASYTGEQMFYNPYVNSLDYGVQLTPKEIGPDFALAVNNVRQQLEPDPKDLKLLRLYDNSSYAREFAATNISPFTTDQLIERILTLPNWEYYTLLCLANDDQTMLRATWELDRAHPILILRYSVRNLIHFIFNPGYKHSRYNLYPFGPEGLIFWPSFIQLDPEEITLLPARAAREIRFNSFSRLPLFLRRAFGWLRQGWLENYRRMTAFIAIFMCVAWMTVIAALTVRLFKRHSPDVPLMRAYTAIFDGGLAASVIMASLVFGYNAAVTAVFAEPDYRYRQMVDTQAILIAGLGLIAICRWASLALGKRFTPRLARPFDEVSRRLCAIDPWRHLSVIQLVAIALGVTAGGFGFWTIFVLKNSGW